MTGTGIIINDSGFQGLNEGDVVAFDPRTNKYVLAQPNWVMDDETIKPAPEAYIAGIICSQPDINGNAQLLVSGTINGSAYTVAGDYYLDANGRMSQTVSSGILPVYCGYLTNSGQFIFKPAAPVYAGHRHTVYPLTSGWSGGSGAWVYADTDTTCNELINSLPPTGMIAVCDNTIIPITSSNISSGRLVLATDNAPTSVTLYGTNPLATIEPEVTSIAPATGNTVIKATKAYGTVYLDTEYPVVASGGVVGSAITSISNQGITTAPVVNAISAGGGIAISSGSDGVHTLTAAAYASGALLDCQTFNANNVLIGATANDALITFPQGVDASIIGIVRTPKSEVDQNVQVFAWMEGVGDTITGSVTWTTISNGSANTSSATITLSAVAGASAGSLNEVTDGAMVIPGNALVTIDLGHAANGTNAVYLKALGIKLN